MKKTAQAVARHPVTRRLFLLGVVVASIVVLIWQVIWMGKQKDALGGLRLGIYSREISVQTQRIFCENCNGSGIVRDPADPEKALLCPVCFGLGVHQVRQMVEQDVMCPACRGVGRLPGDTPNSGRTCDRCDGRGLLRLEKQKFKIYVKQILCEYCDTRGVMPNPELPGKLDMCPICFGMGSHLVRPLDQNDQLCPACGGMGRLFDPDTKEPRECKRCLGRGMVIDTQAQAQTGEPAETTLE